MDTNIFHLVLFGLTYVILVYFVFTQIRKKKFNSGNDNNDDGGIEIYTPPTLDLPPGITLPQGSGPRNKILLEDNEEILC